VSIFFGREAAGALEHPAFPAPSILRGILFQQSSGIKCRENAEVWVRHCEERKRRSNPAQPQKNWIASLKLAMTKQVV
jgi:hypothetical protein